MLTSLIKLQEEEVPSFALKFSFQANMAFMVAFFILSSALAWALRDHRRRLLELATEQQEDRLYLTILGILFVICTMGSYYAFNRTAQRIDDGQSISRNVLVDELYRTFMDVRSRWNQAYYATTNVPYAPDMPVKMPIPKREKLEEVLHSEKNYPKEEWTGLTFLFLMLVILFSVWYFYPRRRPEIAPPRDYMDATPMSERRPIGIGVVAAGSGRSTTKSSSSKSRSTTPRSAGGGTATLSTSGPGGGSAASRSKATSGPKRIQGRR